VEQDSPNDGQASPVFGGLLRRRESRVEPEAAENPDATAAETG